MSLKNVTVSLPEDLLREVRHLAVDKGVSLSRYVAEILEQQVRDRDADNRAMESFLERMHRGMDLGTHGNITWTRDELYER